MHPPASNAAAAAAEPPDPNTHPHSPTTSDYAAAFAHALEATIDGVAEAIQTVSADLPSPMELEGGGNGQYAERGLMESVQEGMAGEVAPAGVGADEFDWEQVRLPGGGLAGW
jgi:hypothetical protein